MTRYIQRHSLLKRVIHGIHMVACIMLIITGLVVFIPALATAVGKDVVQAIRVGHKVFAAIFIAGPLVGMIVAPKGFVHIIKNIFAPWDEDDKKFMMLFPKYLFSPKTTHMPAQHETKSGQRLADGALVAASVVMVISGVLLWAGSQISPVVFRYALLAHDICFVLVSVLLLAHAYLGAGVFQPYRGLHRLMLGNGRVTEAEARYHWAHWAEEELANGDKVIEVEEG